MKMDVTAEMVRAMLRYDAETGAFTWAAKGRAGRVKFGKAAGRISPSTGYHDIGLGGRLYRAHRLAWLYTHGEWPKGHIDHIDGNPLNNKLSNLRDVSRSQNMHNTKLRSDSSSGVAGVHKTKNGTFRAAIVLGTFATAEEAEAIYRQAKEMFHTGYVA